MSDYRHMRVIRCKVDMNKIGVSPLGIVDMVDENEDVKDE